MNRIFESDWDVKYKLELNDDCDSLEKFFEYFENSILNASNGYKNHFPDIIEEYYVLRRQYKINQSISESNEGTLSELLIYIAKYWFLTHESHEPGFFPLNRI